MINKFNMLLVLPLLLFNPPARAQAPQAQNPSTANSAKPDHSAQRDADDKGRDRSSQKSAPNNSNDNNSNDGGFDDPFFSQDDADIKQTPADTRWQSEQELRKQVQHFVHKKSLLKQYRALVKHKFFSLTLKARGLATVQQINDTADDGFAFSQVRMLLRGKLDHGFSYKGQLDISRNPALIDAILTYTAFPFLRLSIGRMKPPFSRSYMTSRTRIDFVDRAQFVHLLNTGRSQGLQISGSLLGEGLVYRFGVFDAADMRHIDYGRSLLYSGRLVLTPLRQRLVGNYSELSLGFSASYGRNEADDFLQHQALRELGDWHGQRLLLGADAQLRFAALRINGEYLFAQLEQQNQAGPVVQVSGGYLGLVYALSPEHFELMLRYDLLKTSLSAQLSQFVIAGLRIYATDFFRVQLNYAWGPAQGRNESWSPNQLRAAFQFDL